LREVDVLRRNGKRRCARIAFFFLDWKERAAGVRSLALCGALDYVELILWILDAAFAKKR
jgi:hypothetical protein